MLLGLWFAWAAIKHSDRTSQFRREAHRLVVTWASASLLGFNFFSRLLCIRYRPRAGKWAERAETGGWIVYPHKNNLSIAEDAWRGPALEFCCPKQMAFSCYWSGTSLSQSLPGNKETPVPSQHFINVSRVFSGGSLLDLMHVIKYRLHCEFNPVKPDFFFKWTVWCIRLI